MAEQIYTIPITEAFSEKDGCPLCRLRRQLESDSLSYVMGAAMMEPDVRLRTNRLGFCRTHCNAMLEMKNRLSLGLMLESHLDTVASLFTEDDGGKKSRLRHHTGPTPAAAAAAQAESCFVCSRVRGFEDKYIDNTVHLWKKDAAFRELFAEQPWFCLRHYALLLDQAQSQLSEERFSVFCGTITQQMQSHVRALRADVTGFCRSFDYRGDPLTQEQRSAVARACDFLTGL